MEEPATLSTGEDRASADAERVAEVALLASLRAGDERAFMMLVEMYHAALLRLARMYVSDPAVAEEVAQETWLAVLRGLGRFEGRSTLKTWIFRILMNIARTRGAREGRTIPFSALDDPASEFEPSVPEERFLPPSHPHWPGHWASPPTEWDLGPEERLLSDETREVIEASIRDLRPSQREVITLRDIEGLDAPEVCSLLGISDGNQRVLLHRARSRVRMALEHYFDREGHR